MGTARQAKVTHHPGESGGGWLCDTAGDGSVSRNLLRVTCVGCLSVVEEALDSDALVIHPNGAIAWRDQGTWTT